MFRSVFKEEIADNLDMSLRTFQRRLKKVNLVIPRGLISPMKQEEIYKKLGYDCVWERLTTERIEKRW